MVTKQSRSTTKTSKPTLVTGPTAEPVTLAEVKRQVFLPESDTSRDAELVNQIQAVREQWERDTDSVMLTTTFSVNADGFCGREIVLPSRPIQSITHVKYYDSSNAQQTLSASLYSLDAQSRTVRLNWDASWPTTYARWDAVLVTYVAGYASQALVPAIMKQAMLLAGGYYLCGNRGDNDRPNDSRAYEHLVRKFMRSTYP